MNFRKPRRRRHVPGLTILELLVVVTVLMLLAGILLPAVLQARSAARRTACQSNLRQWGLAANVYADTHDGRLPRRGQGIQPTGVINRPEDWFNALPPLMEYPAYSELIRMSRRPRAGNTDIWICPEAEDTHHVNFFSYGMNMALSTWLIGLPPEHIDRVGPQRTMVFMADGLGPYCSVFPSSKPYSPLDRHDRETVNVAFLDGHVEAYAGDYVGCGSGDPERPDIRWVPPNAAWPGPPK